MDHEYDDDGGRSFTETTFEKDMVDNVKEDMTLLEVLNM